MKTLTEWCAYVDALAPEALHDELLRANQIRFVRELRSRGMPAKEITALFEHFARRVRDQGDLPPAGGYYDLRKMSR